MLFINCPLQWKPKLLWKEWLTRHQVGQMVPIMYGFFNDTNSPHEENAYEGNTWTNKQSEGQRRDLKEWTKPGMGGGGQTREKNSNENSTRRVSLLYTYRFSNVCQCMPWDWRFFSLLVIKFDFIKKKKFNSELNSKWKTFLHKWLFS